EQLAEIKRLVVEVATDTAVLNADDPLCLAMADYTESEHLCYVTMNPKHGLVREHIRSGGRAVVLEQGINGDMITLFDNGSHIPLLWTHLIPATMEGKATHNVQNAMFAAGLAFSLGKRLEDISHGLRTFATSFFQAPGRMNVYDEHPFKVILDYAHNADAVQKMSQLVARLDTDGRKVAVLAAPGDRRDEDVENIARAAAGAFDYYILKRDDNLRGRGELEVPTLLRDTLLAAGVDAERVEIIADEQLAVEGGLKACHGGDLLVIFGDDVTRCWKQIVHFEAGGGARPPLESTPTLSRVFAPEEAEEFVLQEGQRLIRDERGVRLAKDEQGD
ncbi:MAG: cyanophycin synthetase, partial [Pseudomonadota bacterium]